MKRSSNFFHNALARSAAASFALAVAGASVFPLFVMPSAQRGGSASSAGELATSQPRIAMTAPDGWLSLAIDDLHNFVPLDQRAAIDWSSYLSQVRSVHTFEGRANGEAQTQTDRALAPIDLANSLSDRALRSAYETIRRQPRIPLSDDLCERAGEGGAADIWRIAAAFEDFRADSLLSVGEAAAQRSCLMAFDGAASFQTVVEARLRSVLDDAALMSVLHANFAAWRARDTWENTTEAGEQYTLRHNAAQILADSIRRSFGFDPIPVYVVPLPEDVMLLGQYLHDLNGRPAIIMNYHDQTSPMNDPTDFMLTIVEEALHSVDFALADQFRAGRIHPDDPAFTHAAMIYINRLQGSYIEAHDWEGYREQYIERHAKNHRVVFRAGLAERMRDSFAWAQAIHQADGQEMASSRGARTRGAVAQQRDPT